MGFSAKVILDSIGPNGARLTTMEVTFPRFILAEFNTHRAYSRNSASSRAIPVEKQIQRVLDDPFVPERFPVNQKGMQASAFYSINSSDHAACVAEWLEARDSAVRHATALLNLKVHKQIANRLLEPFMWHTVIVSATEWRNFFDQRCGPLAQPEMQTIAAVMRAAYTQSEPRPREDGDWHTPYVKREDFEEIGRLCMGAPTALFMQRAEEVARKVSVARCARVSYLTHDGKRDIPEDLALYDRLWSADPKHYSPFEHVAQASRYQHAGSGNFKGWNQLRAMLGG